MLSGKTQSHNIKPNLLRSFLVVPIMNANQIKHYFIIILKNIKKLSFGIFKEDLEKKFNSLNAKNSRKRD